MFDDSEYSDELEVAVEAAEAAGEVIDEYADGEAEIQGSKSSPGDIYTEADIRAQERIVEVISESFPDDGFLAEEEMEYREEGKGGRRWVIDPVDGTTNFQKGLDYFCTSIAFEVKGETRVGVVYSPESGLSSLFLAVQGSGAYRSSSPGSLEDLQSLEVSQVKDRRKALVFSRVSDFDGEHRDQKELWSELAEEGSAVRYMSSGALEISKVASGSGEAFMSHTESRWDFAAAELIAREAGAFVEVQDSKVSGKYRVLVSNPDLKSFVKGLSVRFYE